MPSLTIMSSTVSEESLARDTRTHRRTHTHTHTEGVGSTLKCAKSLKTLQIKITLTKQIGERGDGERLSGEMCVVA